MRRSPSYAIYGAGVGTGLPTSATDLGSNMSKLHNRGVTALREGFHGRIEVRFEPAPITLQGLELAKARGALTGRIRGCTACPLHTTVSSPTPYSGPRTPLCVAIGEGPGAQEEKQGAPFVGPSGKLLRSLLREVGIKPETVFYTNTVQCHPKKAVNTRPPTHQEQQWCRHHLMDALKVAQSPYVLLVGSSATSAWRDDLKVTNVHGRIFLWRSRFIVMPVLHPAGVMRQPHLKKLLKGDLQLWANFLKGGGGSVLLDYLGVSCVSCNGEATRYDPDGVPYCETHYARYGMKSYEKQWKRWTGSVVVPNTLDLGDVPVVERKRPSKKPKKGGGFV